MKDLSRRIFSDQILRDKAFDIAKHPKYHGYQRSLALVASESFNKKTAGGVIKNEIMSNRKLAKNYTIQSLENLRNSKYTHLLWTIIGVSDLAEMQLISKFNKGIRFFYDALLIFLVNMHGLFL